MAEVKNHAKFEVSWLKRADRSTQKPDPAYPNGVIANLSKGAVQVCQVNLQYPAPCPGTHFIRCKLCGITVAVTAAGRVDDPTVAVIACAGII
jgi:hypothetical protein